MPKFFRNIAGKSFYCDEKGILTKDADANFVEKPASDADAKEVNPEEVADAEVAKMLERAGEQAKSIASKGLIESQVKAVEAIDSLFKSISESAKKHTNVSTEEKASFNVDEVKDGFKALASKKVKSFTFEIGNVKELKHILNKSTSVTVNVGDGVIIPDRVAGVTRDPVRNVFIESIADVTPNMSADALSYVECVSESGAPMTTAELGEISEKDFTFAEYKAELKKVTIINKHSVEILSDAAQLVSAMKGWLNEDINIEVDTQLLTGNGIGENLTGIFGLATVLDDTAVGSKRVAHANLADVIRVAITKINKAGKGKFYANYVLLNPEDADALDLTKDANGQYVLAPFRSADGTMIKGARVIENTGVTEGKFLVGDFTKLHIGTKGGVEVEMTNSDGNDFKHDILTVKLRRRVASYVRTNDNGAFQTGDISDVIDALTQS